MFNKSFLSKELAMLLLQQIFLMNRQYSASSVLDHEKYSLVRKSFLIIHLISLFFYGFPFPVLLRTIDDRLKQNTFDAVLHYRSG